MYNLIPVLASIDPTEVEGLLSRFGLHPTVLAIVLYAIAVINFLIPVVGPFVYRLFGKQIDQVKTALASFKDYVREGFEKTNAVIERIDTSLNKIAEQNEVARETQTEIAMITDLLIEVLKYSRVSDEVKEKVEIIRATKAVREAEYSRKISEQTSIIETLRKDIAAIKETQRETITKAIANKKNKRR